MNKWVQALIIISFVLLVLYLCPACSNVTAPEKEEAEWVCELSPKSPEEPIVYELRCKEVTP